MFLFYLFTFYFYNVTLVYAIITPIFEILLNVPNKRLRRFWIITENNVVQNDIVPELLTRLSVTLARCKGQSSLKEYLHDILQSS